MGNLYFLWMFGDNVEERLGSLCGDILTLALCGAESCALPHLGGSGAIAGAMGACLVLFPHSRIVKSLGGFFFYGVVIKLPAWGYLGFWILFQFGAGALGLPAVGWRAHVGGFLSGAAVGLLYRRIVPKE